MKVKKRIFVVDGDTRKTLSIVRSLGATNTVFVLSKKSFSIASASKYCAKAFLRDDGELVDQVIKLCTLHEMQFLIATQEETLIRLARAHARIAEVVTPTFPVFEVLDFAFDKSKTLEIAQACDLLIPKTIFPCCRSEILCLSREIGFPLVLKPHRSVSIEGENTFTATGPVYARNEQELEEALRALPMHIGVPMIQEYVQGTGVGGFFLMNKQGEIVSEFAHERIRDVNPKGSGSCFRKSIFVDNEVRKLSTRLLKAMEWEGVAMVEYRRTPEGKYYLMEVNGRFWGSLDLARQSGINFPENLVRIYNSESVSACEYKSNIYVRWLLGDVLRTLRILRGKPSGYPGKYPSRFEGLREWLDRRNFTARLEVLKLHDPLPFLAEVLSVIGR